MMVKKICFGYILCVLTAILMLGACGTQPPHKKTSVVVFDADFGTDDAVALLLAADISDSMFDYIIASQGNASLDGAVQNTIVLKKYLGLNAAVVQGMSPPADENTDETEKNTFHGSDGLANMRETMINSLAVTKEELEGFIKFEDFTEKITAFDEIIYIATGPTTNLANLIGNETVKSKITKVYIMGGGIRAFNCSNNTEFNFSKDPQSVKKILASGLDITLFPLDLTNDQRVTAEETAALAALGAYPEYIRFLEFNLQSNKAYNDIPAAIIHDAMPVLYYADPGLFQTEDMKITVDQYGATKVSDDGATIHVATGVKDALLTERLRDCFQKRAQSEDSACE